MINNDKIKIFFDSIASNWVNDNDINKIKSLLDIININKGDDVLDLGCGKGIITPLIYEYTQKQVDAMDISNEMIKEAKKINNKNCYNFICADFYNYDFNKKYDKVIIFDAYPHFLDKKLFKEKVLSILKDNGILAIVHDLSRKELNKYHDDHATMISIPLNEINLEYKKYADEFISLKMIDDDSKYLLLLQKII